MLRFTFVNLARPGRYTISAAVGDRDSRLEAYAFAEDVAALLVQAPHCTGGVADLPFEFEVDAPVSAEPAVTRYRGPSAIGDDLRRFWGLTWMLAATDFKLRFFGSALGYLWTLMRPLLLFGVLYFVFTEVVRFGGGHQHYPVIPAQRDRAVHVLLGDHQPRGHARSSSARTCCGRSASRGW